MIAENYGLLWLDEVPLTDEWEIVVIPITCSEVELTGDVDWAWCTNTEGAVRSISKFERHIVVKTRTIAQGLPLCYVKAEQAGTLYRKFTR